MTDTASHCVGMASGSRNGYGEVTVKTTEAFASRLFGNSLTKTNAMESRSPPSSGDCLATTSRPPSRTRSASRLPSPSPRSRSRSRSRNNAADRRVLL